MPPRSSARSSTRPAGATLDHARDWVALVDGNNHQIQRISAEAEAREVEVTIVCDFVPVLEYLWKAAWCFHREGDPAAERWVRRHAQRILAGEATKVAGAIRRAATKAGLDPPRRAGADACAAYLTNKAAYLDYATALERGWPIATGVIEGACRHLVKDRMDLTGARWGLDGAEAILKLRAISANGDFDKYWRFHLAQEHQRVHRSRYTAGHHPTDHMNAVPPAEPHPNHNRHQGRAGPNSASPRAAPARHLAPTPPRPRRAFHPRSNTGCSAS